jgi:SAM-dependent methyltransferase
MTVINTVPCNYCAVDDASVRFEAGEAQVSQIVQCNRCGLMYASPRVYVPDHVSIETYDPEYIIQQVETSGRLRLEKELLQVHDYARTRSLLGQLHPGRGSLVEVGCGLGMLLEEFRKDGWEVLGIEPNRGYCRLIEKDLGIRVIPTILESAGIPDASADVVVMLHVIEHVPDPLGTLQEIYRILKPGGHLVMETPRYDTVTFRLLGKRERSLNCCGHIYFFTTETLRRAYEKAGFRTVRCDYVGRSVTLERLMWNLGIISKSDSVQRGLSSLARKLRLNRVRLYVNMRDMQRVCVEKPA